MHNTRALINVPGGFAYLQMLDHLAEPHTSGVRTDRDSAALGGHQVDGQALVQAAHPGRVDLAVLEGRRLQELLEHDSVLAHLAGRNANA